MSAPYFAEIFKEPIDEFIQHLKKEANQRIVFSGKYGTGKTSFLKEFFTPDIQQMYLQSDEFEPYYLFPVNYSVASNQDIIRYIKYDLIIQLLQKMSSIEEIEIGFLKTFPTWLKNNLHKVAAAIVRMVPKVGKEIVEVFDRIDQLKEEFLKFHDEQNNSVGDKMIAYLESLEAEEGSLYENDVITRIIASTIIRAGKKPVLIIDDLDRLDPEHIFRILNVFAAHFDTTQGSGGNKFGFDKILLVCDFRNIRKVFHYKYGQDVDFTGYADKFYSSDVYRFDNNKSVTAILDGILHSMTWESNGAGNISKIFLGDALVSFILQAALQNGLISLRSIVKMHRRHISYNAALIDFSGYTGKRSPYIFPIMLQLRLIRDFLGDYDALVQMIDRFRTRKLDFPETGIWFKYLLLISAEPIHNFFKEGKFEMPFDSLRLWVTYAYSMSSSDIKNIEVFKILSRNEDGKVGETEPFHCSISQFWFTFQAAVERLHDIGYIK